MYEDSISITSPTSLDSIPTSAMSLQLQPQNPLPEDLSASTSSKGKEKEPVIEEDEDYFMQSSFVYFQVENRLFHVPNYRFTSESHIFSRMFKLPQANAVDVEGASRSNPIKLPEGPDGIRHIDFKNFMKALYPLNVSITLSLSKPEWISVLKLSSFWYFLGFRKIAISELERMKELTSVEKITFGRHVKVSRWIVAGYEELIYRNEPMTKEEALLIDYETTFSLFRIRELRLKGQKPGPIEEKLESEFAWELGNVRAEEKGYEGVVDDIPLRSPTMSPGPPVCGTRPPTPSRPPSPSCSKPSPPPQEWSIAEEPQPMLGSGSFGWGFGSAPVPVPSPPHEPPSSWAFDSASAGGKNRKSSKKR